MMEYVKIPNIFKREEYGNNRLIEGNYSLPEIRVVPLVSTGTLQEAVEFVRLHPKSLLRDAEMEGIVCRPLHELFDRRGNRIITKVKCRDFEKTRE